MDDNSFSIRQINPLTDQEDLWEILCPILRQGETYALPRDWTKDATLEYWCHISHTVYVLIHNTHQKIIGTYFIHDNQKGGGSHVCNCGYATHQLYRNNKIGYLMCLHSLKIAKELNYYAMQYNFVISTNIYAIQLWQKCGFQIVGTLPNAFLSPTFGHVDVYVMFQKL